jgi:hypothetical protein
LLSLYAFLFHYHVKVSKKGAIPAIVAYLPHS